MNDLTRASTDDIRGVVARDLGVSIEKVTLDATVSGLGGDSLDLIELVMELEREFEIDIPDDELSNNVGDLIRAVQRRAR